MTPREDRPSRRSARVWRVLVPLGIVAVAAATRFYALGAKSLWLDEAATMNAIDAPLGNVVASVKACDAHPPLYYALLHIWMHKPLAMTHGPVPAEQRWLFLCRSHSAGQARAFSAAVSVATALVFYWLVGVVATRRAAFLASLVVAVSAFQVYFAQEVRMYALAGFFVALSWYFLVELVAGRRLQRWPMWLGLALANAAAAYTFYYSVFAVAAQVLALLLLWRSIGRKLLVPWLAWQAVPLGLFALYVPVIQERLVLLQGKAPPGGGGPLSLEALRETAAQFTSGFLHHLSGSWGPVVVAVGAAVALATIVLGLGAGRRLGCAAVVGGVWLVAPLLALAAFPFKGHVYEPKHVIFAAPGMAVLLAAALSSEKRPIRRGGLVAFVSLLALNAASLTAYYRPGVEKEDWRGAIGELARRVEPGDYVVFNPPWTELPFLYYYKHVYRGPRVLPMHAPLVPRPFRARQLATGRRVWVLEAASNIAPPNPDVVRSLSGYGPPLFTRRFPGLVGTVAVALFDTLRPPRPRAGGPPTP